MLESVSAETTVGLLRLKDRVLVVSYEPTQGVLVGSHRLIAAKHVDRVAQNIAVLKRG